MDGNQKAGTDRDVAEILGFIELVWYKESVVFIFAIASLILGHFIFFDVRIMDYSSLFILSIPVGILMTFGVIGSLFLWPFFLIELFTWSSLWNISRIEYTRTSLRLVHFSGKRVAVIPFSQITDISTLYNNSDGITWCPEPGDPVTSVTISIAGGRKLELNLHYIVERDRCMIPSLLGAIRSRG